MTFFKTVFASLIGTILAIAIGIFLLFLVFAAISAGSSGEPTVLSKDTIFRLSLDEPIVERQLDGGPLDIDPATFEPRSSLGLDRILRSIKKAAEDDNIKGIYLDASVPQASMSTLEDIRTELEKFKASGKFVYSYAEYYSQKGYWLCSVADEIYLYPQGGLDWTGLNAELMFFKNMLDKVGVEMQVVRGPNNKFKSAVEPFMYDQMSEANREQLNEFISDFWRTMKDDVSNARSVNAGKLQMLADSLSIIRPQDVVTHGLIDGLKYPDEVRSDLAGRLTDVEPADLKFLDLSDYNPAKDKKKDAGEVAVVYAVGDIISGEGDDATIGSDRIAKALRDARLDEDVKAVVLRVNSPGGSALASDVIWRETELLKQSEKPFVVSMGDVAASGGYYISAYADSLFANATTITGSIGVFGVLPNAEKLLEENIGITFDNVATAAHAGLGSVAEPLDEFEYKAIQQSVVHVYDTFVDRVAKGRGMTATEVDNIGQGRVWSGEDALRIGLVDRLGNLNDAVSSAAGMAGMSDYKVKALPKAIDPIQKLMEELSGSEAAIDPERLLGEDFAEVYELYTHLRTIQRIKGIQARLPFTYEVE